MVFQCEARFKKFIHCKFLENVVRVLYVPAINHGFVFLVVNKFGSVGLFESSRFRLVSVFLLHLAVIVPYMRKEIKLGAPKELSLPKCQTVHLLVDAVWAPDLQIVFYLTNKGILLAYDVGEIDSQMYGIELVPSISFGRVTEVTNNGHVETHRVYGLPRFSTCMEYGVGIVDGKNVTPSLILIGDSDGSITIIKVPDRKYVFGCRKIRGRVHEIKVQDLVKRGEVTVCKAHNDSITSLHLSSSRQLVLSTSADRKTSLHVYDLQGFRDPLTISLPRGATSVAESEVLQILATGSEDHLVRLFNQFVLAASVKLEGHRDAVVSVEFIQIPFSPGPILLSLSADVEIRAWDPVTYACLQSVYISFPIKQPIRSKTPEFARHPIFIHQPKFLKSEKSSPIADLNQEGFILVIYCNSFAKLWLEKDATYWPFDFDELATEFASKSAHVQQKLKSRQDSSASCQNPKARLSSAEMQDLKQELDSYVTEVRSIFTKIDEQQGRAMPPNLSAEVARRSFEFKTDPRKGHYIADGGAFKVLPISELEPIPFNKDQIRITDKMREAGLSLVTSPADLLTPVAQNCFSEKSMRDLKVEGKIARLQLFGRDNQLPSFNSKSTSPRESKVNDLRNDPGSFKFEFDSNRLSPGGGSSVATSEPIIGETTTDSDILEEDDILKTFEQIMDLTPEPKIMDLH